MQAKEEPHTASDKSDHVSMKVVSQDGNEVCFRMKWGTPMGKLMSTYCERQHIESSSVRFLFDGERIRETSTPKELGIAEGDMIDAVLEQVGGNNSGSGAEIGAVCSDAATCYTRCRQGHNARLQDCS